MKYQALAAALLCVATVGCRPQTASTDTAYTLDVNLVDSATGVTAYIVNYDTGDKIDSAFVEGSHIAFAGTADSAVLARVLLGNTRLTTFVLEPGKLTIDSGRVASSTPLNTLFNELIGKTDSLSMAYDAASDDSTHRAIDTAYNQLLERYAELHSTNPVGYYAFMQSAYNYDYETLVSKLKKYHVIAASHRASDLLASKQRAKATAPGNRYADFTITSADGATTQSLSQYITAGRYTLVDFWASWCGPCRREMPVIKELYEKFHDKGLDVVGVAVWDEPDASAKAAKQLELPWPQIFNAQKVPTDLYGIDGIPHIMLIDPDGVIVARGMQDDSLRTVVTNSLAGFTPPAPIERPVAIGQR